MPEAAYRSSIIRPPTESFAEALSVTIAPLALVASAAIGDGTVSAGAVLSWTVTVKVALPLFFAAASVAVQVTVVVPIANVLPGTGMQGAAEHAADDVAGRRSRITDHRAAWPGRLCQERVPEP